MRGATQMAAYRSGKLSLFAGNAPEKPNGFIFGRYRSRARVEYGQFPTDLEVWTGDGWSSHVNDAFLYPDASTVLVASPSGDIPASGEEYFVQPWPVRFTRR